MVIHIYLDFVDIKLTLKKLLFEILEKLIWGSFLAHKSPLIKLSY